MDWSKIKTIFILTFLILDIYLLYQFITIRDTNKYEFITEASFEDNLKADEIKYVALPKTPIKGQYVSAKPKIFKNEDAEELKGQSISINNGTILSSVLEKPVQLTSKLEPAEISSFLKNDVLFGDHYQFWAKDDKKKTITYFQQFENKPFYQNVSGMITFNINAKNQIISYEQTYLEKIEKMSQKEEILPPLKAIETLHQNDKLKSKSKVTKVELGYFTLIQLTASQVLAPTWHFVVDDKEDFFVNGFEGQIIQFNNEEKNVTE